VAENGALSPKTSKAYRQRGEREGGRRERERDKA